MQAVQGFYFLCCLLPIMYKWKLIFVWVSDSYTSAISIQACSKDAYRNYVCHIHTNRILRDSLVSIEVRFVTLTKFMSNM